MRENSPLFWREDKGDTSGKIHGRICKCGKMWVPMSALERNAEAPNIFVAVFHESNPCTGNITPPRTSEASHPSKRRARSVTCMDRPFSWLKYSQNCKYIFTCERTNRFIQTKAHLGMRVSSKSIFTCALWFPKQLDLKFSPWLPSWSLAFWSSPLQPHGEGCRGVNS